MIYCFCQCSMHERFSCGNLLTLHEKEYILCRSFFKILGITEAKKYSFKNPFLYHLYLVPDIQVKTNKFPSAIYYNKAIQFSVISIGGKEKAVSDCTKCITSCRCNHICIFAFGLVTYTKYSHRMQDVRDGSSCRRLAMCG